MSEATCTYCGHPCRVIRVDTGIGCYDHGSYRGVDVRLVVPDADRPGPDSGTKAEFIQRAVADVIAGR